MQDRRSVQAQPIKDRSLLGGNVQDPQGTRERVHVGSSSKHNWLICDQMPTTVFIPLRARHQHSIRLTHPKQEKHCFGSSGQRAQAVSHTGARAPYGSHFRAGRHANLSQRQSCQGPSRLPALTWLTGALSCCRQLYSFIMIKSTPRKRRAGLSFSLLRLDNPFLATAVSLIFPPPQCRQYGWWRGQPSPEFLQVLLPSIHKGRGQNILTIPLHSSPRESSPCRREENYH